MAGQTRGDRQLSWWILGTAVLMVCLLIAPYGIVYVYLFSYAHHVLNLAAYVGRSYPPRLFLWHSLLARTVALVLLAVLAWPYVNTPWNHYGLVLLIAGTVLHASAVRALGLQRTYYAVELGALPATRINSIPYNLLPHPMELGSIVQFLGIYVLIPEFRLAYPYLIPLHIGFCLLTAAVEHFDLHLRPHFFHAVAGRFSDPEKRRTIDRLRDWSLDHYRSILHGKSSLHQYVKSLSTEVIDQIDQLRYADELIEPLRHAFPRSEIVPMAMTDEIYISRYNFDHGGDQGLFDKHYDGNLRFLPGASMVRSLIYLSSDDHLEVVFDTSQVRSNMKTYDFGLLDFHREFHWVNGSYDPRNPPRILLKCNYYIDHSGVPIYRNLGILLNLAVFYSVRAAMEYSKTPQTIGQKLIGYACNVFRKLNNVSPALPLALVAVVLALSIRVIAVAFHHSLVGY